MFVFLWCMCGRLSKDQSGYNFDFRLLYKVLPRETAVVRFGGIRREGNRGRIGALLIGVENGVATIPRND